MGPEVQEASVSITGMPTATNFASPPHGMIITLERVHECADTTAPRAQGNTSTGSHKKRHAKRRTDCSSDEEQNLVRALRHRPWISHHHESETSSEDESDPEQVHSSVRASSLPLGVARGCPTCSSCQRVLARWQPEAGCRPSLDEAPVFFPLEEEFRDAFKYIASISAEAEPYGICRIVPPQSWRPPCPLRDSQKRQTARFPTRVQQIHKLQVREAQNKRYTHPKKRKRGRPRKEGPMGHRSLLFAGGNKVIKCQVTDEDDKFGFDPGPDFTLEAFEKYAHHFKEEYFGIQDVNFGCDDSKKKWEPSIENIEGEYWRIVEQATEQIEVLYGADVETRDFGSGFPKAKPGAESTSYESSGWNLNNIARFPGSVLAFEEGDISGVLVPWLYVGMCFSSFCWHVEDHRFYSLNYMHWGSPKVWYGVPSSAASKFEEAMKRCLPDLFEEQPDLLHKLVTQLSPSVLKAAGVSVYRAVQKAGEFVVTFPRAYHAGFNCGFNCAEAVNLAPVDWLPHGQNAVEMYREQRRKTSVSHDKLLLGAAKQAVRTLQQLQEIKGEKELQLGVSGWQDLLGQDGVLAKALKKRVDMERLRRAAVMNIVHARKMNIGFDATHERECFECHYDLHLSAIGCDCYPERYACLEHAQLLCACGPSRKFALFRYDISELDALIAFVEGQSVVNSSRLISAGYEWDQQELEPYNSKPLRQGLQDNGHLQKVGCLNEVISQDSQPESRHEKLTTPDLFRHMSKSGSCEGAFPGKKPISATSEFHPDSVEGVLKPEYSLLEISEEMIKCERQPIDEEKISASQGNCSSLCALNRQVSPSGSDIELIVLSDDDDEKSCDCDAAGSCQVMENHADTSGAILDGFPEKMAYDLKSEEVPVVALQNLEFDSDFGNALKECSRYAKHEVDEISLAQSAGSVEPQLDLKSQIVTDVSPQSIPSCSFEKDASQLERIGRNTELLFDGILEPSISTPTDGFLSPGKDLRSQQKGTEATLGCARPKAQEACESVVNLDFQQVSPLSRGLGSDTAGLVGCSLSAQTHRTGYDVELLNVGRLVLRKHWSNRHAIFPAGFKSRVLFCNILDPLQLCFYNSEVLDCGLSEPLFQVTLEGQPSEVFIHPNIDKCWQMVQQRVNQMIEPQHLLQPSKDLQGLELFGFTSPLIIKAVESLDWQHQCIEYWAGRLSAVELLESQHRVRASCVHGTQCTEGCDNASTHQAFVGDGQVNSFSASMGNKSEEDLGKCGSIVREPVYGTPQSNIKLYDTLRGLFKKATPDELWMLHRLFGNEWEGLDWKEGFKALKDELETIC